MSTNYGRCQCAGCSNLGIIPVSLANRGGRHGYLCSFHATELENYGSGGDNMYGAVDKKDTRKVLKCAGIEFETSNSDTYARGQLLNKGFKPTYDSSLTGENPCEYVSGLYIGMNSAIAQMNKVFAPLFDDGHLYMDDSCGTHFHFSINSMVCEDGTHVMPILYNETYYVALFGALSKALEENPYRCEEFFGRQLCNYAPSISMKHQCWGYENRLFRNSHRDRYLFINPVNDNNIEFRIFKYVSSDQYVKCMKYAEKVTTSIMKHVTGWAYMTEAERIHRLNVCGNKLVKWFMTM